MFLLAFTTSWKRRDRRSVPGWPAAMSMDEHVGRGRTRQCASSDDVDVGPKVRLADAL
jgi:hypothetical protein